MMTTVREPECLALKRRGAEHVAKLVVGMSLQEQLEFWRQRTEAMVIRKSARAVDHDPREPGNKQRPAATER